MHRNIVGSLLWLMALGCARQEETPSTGATSKPGVLLSVPARASTFDARLLEIARTYRSFGQTDQAFRFAPTACAPALPPGISTQPEPPPVFRWSGSPDARSHGRKLYRLFVKFAPDSYAAGQVPAGPVGQAVVKEAWVPEQVEGLTNTKDLPGTYSREDGKVYRPREKSALFVMFKLDPQTPGTDQGWVYGTVTADAKQVTSAGKVESCMRCHLKAPHDRLFGLPGT